MTMLAFLNLVRWKNLLLIALAQILVKYVLLESYKTSYNFDTSLTVLGFTILVVCTLCIASAGYIINDIEDIEADKINKPKKVIIGKYISEQAAFRLFVVLNCIGVALGYFLCYQLEKKGFIVISILVSTLLYFYAIQFKRILIVGNIIVAALVGLSILIVGIFDLIPVLTDSNKNEQVFFLRLILDYAIFAFMINLIRELVKDVEDVNGDYKIQSKSLPIVLGRNRATKVIFGLSLIPIIVLIFYTVNNLYKQPMAIVYVLLTLVGPMIYVSIRLFSAEKKEDYSQISNTLKFIMLMGLLSIVLLQFIL